MVNIIRIFMPKKKGNATNPEKGKKEICIVYSDGIVKFPNGKLFLKESLTDLIIF